MSRDERPPRALQVIARGLASSSSLRAQLRELRARLGSVGVQVMDRIVSTVAGGAVNTRTPPAPGGSTFRPSSSSARPAPPSSPARTSPSAATTPSAPPRSPEPRSRSAPASTTARTSPHPAGAPTAASARGGEDARTSVRSSSASTRPVGATSRGSGTDARPASGSDARPASGSDARPASGSDARPARGADIRPARGADAESSAPAASSRAAAEVGSARDEEVFAVLSADEPASEVAPTASPDRGRPEPDEAARQPLPVRSGEERLVLLARDPAWSFAYWEVDVDRLEELHRKSPGSYTEIRLHLADLVQCVRTDRVDPGLGHYYFRVPFSGRPYLAELAFVSASGEEVVILARSEVSWSPRTLPGPEGEVRFASLDEQRQVLNGRYDPLPQALSGGAVAINPLPELVLRAIHDRSATEPARADVSSAVNLADRPSSGYVGSVWP